MCPSSLNVFFVLLDFGFGQLLESDQILKISCFTGALVILLPESLGL